MGPSVPFYTRAFISRYLATDGEKNAPVAAGPHRRELAWALHTTPAKTHALVSSRLYRPLTCHLLPSYPYAALLHRGPTSRDITYTTPAILDSRDFHTATAPPQNRLQYNGTDVWISFFWAAINYDFFSNFYN